MTRTLDERDQRILLKLAPELKEMICAESGHEFHSILPPVSNHVAEDGEDFRRRIGRLDPQELEYIADRILDGSEHLGCLPEEDMESFASALDELVSHEKAESVMELYRRGGACNVGDLQ
ncbi:MAG: hypothetical protein QHG99_03080 [Methanomicrobiales archaeon]|nr:hypothetical protein [Methanomicrobiales archaeon]